MSSPSYNQASTACPPPRCASIVEELVRIPSTGCDLGGCLAYPADGSVSWRALIAGPHPLLGGELHNNVVRAFQTGFAAKGAASLTLEYSVPQENSAASNAWADAIASFWRTNHVADEPRWAMEIGDSLLALRTWGNGPIVLVGYSFGCWTVTENLDVAGVSAVVLVSPNPKTHCFERLERAHPPLLVVHAEDDFACDRAGLHAWLARIPEPTALWSPPSGQHFLRGLESPMLDRAIAFLREWSVVPEDCR